MNRVFAPDESFATCLLESKSLRRWPADARKVMFFLFALTPATILAGVLYNIPRLQAGQLVWNLFLGPGLWLYRILLPAVAAWSIWKAKSFARSWAVAASFMYILEFVQPYVFSSPRGRSALLPIHLLVGLLGLACFAWPDQPTDSPGAS